MKRYEGFKTQPIFNGRQKLPAGVYVAKVYDVTHDVQSWGERLIIEFDIHEGEHANFFRRDWDTADPSFRKWRGTYRLNVPKGDDTEQDKFARRVFEQSMWAFEESNAQFHWNWDENQLKGLFVGVRFRNREYEFNGTRGWTTECCGLVDIQSVRAGKVKVPKDKPLPEAVATAQPTDASGFTDIPDSELPF